MRFIPFILVLFSLALAQDKRSPKETAPSFSLRNLDNKYEKLRTWCGSTLRSPHINKQRHTVILSFWSTTCLPCLKEIPLLHEFYNKHKNKNIKIFCISVDSKGDAVVAPHIKKYGWTLPVLIDRYAVTAKKYGLVKTENGRKQVEVPTLIVIDTMQQIIYKHKGFEEQGFIANLEEIIWPSSKDNDTLHTENAQ